MNPVPGGREKGANSLITRPDKLNWASLGFSDLEWEIEGDWRKPDINLWLLRAYIHPYIAYTDEFLHICTHREISKSR